MDLLTPSAQWVIPGNRFGMRAALAYALLRAADTGEENPLGWSNDFYRFHRGYVALLRDLRILLLFGEGEMSVDLVEPAFCYDVRRHQPLGFTGSPALVAANGPASVAAPARRTPPTSWPPVVKPSTGSRPPGTIPREPGECGRPT